MPPTRAYLFAHPVKHSLSPIMHNATLNALGIDAQYEAEDIPPEALLMALEGLRQSKAWGANLSIPHKETVLEHLDSVSPEAKVIGAVNTIVLNNGLLEGHNTDAYGFMRSLEEAGINVKNSKIIILGAGGAARAVIYGLKQAGATVLIWNRSSERAKALAEEFDLKWIETQILPASIRTANGLVNTTSVGLEQPHSSPVSFDLQPKHWVCDIVYRPLETKLLKNARDHNLQCLDGLGMLVHQGAKAFELWTGQHPDTDLMRQVALKALGF
jgi:shikimate dehydrogenase